MSYLLNLYMNFKSFFYFFRLLGKTELFCVAIIVYMLILILGTLAQKNFGIQYVKDYYFNSIYFFINDIFLFPGGKIILSIIFIGLVIRLCLDKWKKKKIGIFLIHFGALILILSAFFFNLDFNKEGLMIIEEGKYADNFISKNTYEIIIKNKSRDKIVLKNINNKFNINFDNIDFNFNLISNCDLTPKYNFTTNNNSIEKFFSFNKIPDFVENEKNKSVLSVLISEDKNVELFFIFEDVDFKYKNINITFKKKIEHLPFKIFLSKFKKENYPGTNTAKSYVSDIIVKIDSNFLWRYNLEVNKPFNFMGYTFYQTSFIDNGISKFSVFTVVKNSVSFLPYISLIFILSGFVLHTFFYIRKIFRYKDE